MAITFEDLVNAVVGQESSWNPNAVSRKGAVGLGQIMPATARQYGVNPARLNDPWVNMGLTQRLLRKYANQYQGNIPDILTAYDAGPGRVGNPKLPAETQDYISKILGKLQGTAYAGEPTDFEDVPDPWKGGAPASSGPPKSGGDWADVPDPWKGASPPAGVPSVQTPEQRYEQQVAKLPSLLQDVAPGTMGEAGFVLGALGAPLSGGMSLAVPLAGAAIGGALEDPKNMLPGAAYETAKGVGQEVGGKILSKGFEWGSRFAQKTGMLERTRGRIWQGIGSLMSQVPIPMPQTKQEFRDVVSGGELQEAAGRRLGKFRDYLKQLILDYQPAVAPKLVPASSGVPFSYTAGTPATGLKFTLPDYAIDKNGDPIRITNDFSITEAIDHVRKLQAESFTASGNPKSGDIAWLRREVAHGAREALIEKLNKFQAGLGDAYGAMSGDYGAASELTGLFKGVYRSDGEIDQPKLLGKIDASMLDLKRLKGNDRGRLFARSISPTGAEAIPEENLMTRMHAGQHGLFTYLHPPVPYWPETPQLLRQPWRVLSNPKLAPLLGALGLQGGEDVLGVKGEPIVEGGP